MRESSASELRLGKEAATSASFAVPGDLTAT
jgi:hypothetical protein